MRRLVVALLVLGSATRTFGDPPPPAPPAPPAPSAAPRKPLTVRAAAEAAIAAAKAGDTAAVAALAAADDPDPWAVAEGLLDRAEPEAAAAFATAAPRTDVAALPAYVASRRGQAPDPVARAAVMRVTEAMSRRDPAAALAALEGVEGDPKTVTGIRLRLARAIATRASKGGLLEGAKQFLAAARLAEDLGWLATASHALGEVPATARAGGDLRLAQDAAERRAEVEARRGRRAGVAAALAEVADVERVRGELDAADVRSRRALATAEEAGDPVVAAGIRASMANLAVMRGEYARAIELGEAAHAAMTALGDRVGAAATLSNLGLALRRVGDHARAVACFRAALRSMEERGDALNAARTYANLGNACAELGRYAEAIASHERAIAIAEDHGAAGVAAAMYGDLGLVHGALGDAAKAVECMQEALRRLRRLGDRPNVRATLSNLAATTSEVGRHDEAFAAYREALALAEAAGDKPGSAQARNGLGSVAHALGRMEEALEHHEHALAAYEALGDPRGANLSRSNVAIVLARLGRWERATEELDRAIVGAERLGGGVRLARLLGVGARMDLDRGDPERARVRARQAVELFGAVFGGLGEEQGARLRERFHEVFATGVRAAARAGSVRDVSFFLEAGRAATLLESLGGRASLRAVVLPDALRLALAEADAAEVKAAAAHRVAVDAGDRAAIREKGAALAAARERSTALFERVQREAKRAAGVAYPHADALDALQARLAVGDALVSFALTAEEALALVVTRTSARVVPLGTTEAVERACAAAACDDPAADPTAALATLREAVVDPLALPDDVKRVVLVTDGVLSYVPFGALLEGRDVAYTPSGTTQGQLLEERDLRGGAVLALGDPAYGPGASVVRSGALARLPGTAAEARAVGDVVLLGAEATEAGLRRAVATRARWRAVHLACHGLLDPERPLLCALALTPADGDDGFLFAREVLRAHVPADLVVLSACETARGRVYEGEGLLGLTRAFMFAGSPRVICSLWKVDDDATAALMTKFYELWNPRAQPDDPERAERVEGSPGPGLPAAQALREAQAFVRSHDKWKHPYYWAAWVLWGLPQ